MRILQTNTFKKAVKKLHANQKANLNQAIKAITANPYIGVAKTGDLFSARIYKFSLVNQLTLLAYTYNQVDSSIILLALGSHENFYRDLKIINNL